LQWDTTLTPTKSGPDNGLVNAIGAPSATQLFIDIATSFAPGQNFTVGNLGFRNFTTVSPPQPLQMSLNGGGSFPFTDSNGFSIRVADIPSVVTSPAQTISPG